MFYETTGSTGDDCPASHPPMMAPFGFTAPPADPADPAARSPERAASSIEVTIAWGDNILALERVEPSRSFLIGEQDGVCDFALAGIGFGDAPLPLVSFEDGAAYLTAPLDADGVFTPATGVPLTFREAACAAPIAPDGGPPRFGRVRLSAGARATVALAGLTFVVRAVGREERFASPSFAPDTSALVFTTASLVAHAGIFAALAALAPPFGLVDSEDVARDRIYWMGQLLQASAERERVASPASAGGSPGEVASDGDARTRSGHTDRPHRSDRSGGMPMRTARADAPDLERHGAMGTPGPTSHAEALREATSLALIGILQSDSARPRQVSDAWNGALALANDERGSAFVPLAAEWGPPGLEVSGTGDLGDAPGLGLGPRIGGIGTICGGDGADCLGGAGGSGDSGGRANGGPGGGFDGRIGRTGPAHQSRGPMLRRAGETTVNGHLPADVIQRIVRQN